MAEKESNIQIHRAFIAFGTLEEDGKSAIYLDYNGKKYILFPDSLVEMLIYKEGNMVASCKEKDFWNGTSVYYQDCVDKYSWLIGNYITHESAYLFFPKEQMHEWIRSTFNQLYDELRKGNKTLYDDDRVNADTIKYYIGKMDLLVPISNSKSGKEPFSKIQDMTFECTHRQYDIEYKLILDGYEIKDCISDWSTNLSELRRMLEGSNEIKLYCEDEPTTIKFVKAGNPVENINNISTAIVVIHPGISSQYPILVGYCEPKQVIKAIYEGLLRMASIEFHDKETSGTWDNLDNMTFYNKIKSPIIENLIRYSRPENSDIECRQVFIKHVITISPDYDQMYIDENRISEPMFEDDGTAVIEFEDTGKMEFNIPGYKEWYDEYLHATDFVKCETSSSPDYGEWARRGIEFACALREQLPDCIDLWYEPPFEDKKRRGKKAELIYKQYKGFCI